MGSIPINRSYIYINLERVKLWCEMSRLQRIIEHQLCGEGGVPVKPPRWLEHPALHYEVQMGSNAYGVADESFGSDEDIYGFVIPPKELLFPHLVGHVYGFGTEPKVFEQWQQHHIDDPAARKQYDIVLFNIVKYFDLCYDSNPNMIDSLFVPMDCIFHITQVGQHLRDNRKLFLSKRCWPKFKGYAYSQLNKMSNKKPTGKRLATVEEYGYDVKFAYHIVRLMNECEMILLEGDLDIRRNREQLKSIRRGEWSEEQLREYFTQKENTLEAVYAKSFLPDDPDENKIKRLLLECLEMHYGKITKEIIVQTNALQTLQEIYRMCGKALEGE